jgi:hypothetical protein
VRMVVCWLLIALGFGGVRRCVKKLGMEKGGSLYASVTWLLAALHPSCGKERHKRHLFGKALHTSNGNLLNPYAF